MDPKEQLARAESRARIFSAYFSVVTALLLPFAVAASAWWINRANAQQTCIKENAALTDKIIREENVDGRRAEAWRASMAAHADLLAETCASVGVAIPAVIRVRLAELWRATSDPATAKSLSNAITKTEEVATLTAQASGVLKLAAQVADTKQPPTRLYIHIVSESQRPDARSVQERLREARLGDEALEVPGVQLVDGGPTATEVRCFRKKECDEAEALLGVVNGALVTPKAILKRLDARYENSRDIRPRHYELWFAPGPIQIAN